MDHRGRFGNLIKGEYYDPKALIIQKALEEAPQIFGHRAVKKATEKVETASADGGVETR